MKLTLFLFLLFAVLAAPAQSLKKYAISNSGCSMESYCTPKFKTDFSEDSSTVYTGECVSGNITYGVICVKLLNPVTNLVMAEDLMKSYLDFLKGSFDITKTAGFEKNLLLNDNRETRGVMEYWEDKSGDKWKIKSWTDGNFIGFMYAYSNKALPEDKVNAFLDGFKFPEKK
jgi:hypothetical protein